MNGMTRNRPRRVLSFLIDYLGMAGALAALVAIFAFKTDHFLTDRTLGTIANQIPDLAIMAVGMTFVLIVAGIDLSVGSVMALSGAAMGTMIVTFELPIGLAVAACLALGLVCGLANGLISVRWRLPSFIVTLGMLEIARGATYLVTDSRTIYIGQKLAFLTEPIMTSDSSTTISFSWLTWPFVAAVLIVIFAQFVLSRTVFGRYMIAVGTNEEATRLSGIDPRPVKVAVFTICGLLAAVAAVIHTARYQANPNNGVGMELQVIAAVVIGGTSLMGGRGSVISTFFGVLIIKVLETGLAQAGAGEPTKRLVTGCVIVAAVILDFYRQRLAKNSGN